jgi:hypothetical protein
MRALSRLVLGRMPSWPKCAKGMTGRADLQQGEDDSGTVLAHRPARAHSSQLGGLRMIQPLPQRIQRARC